ncbi:hypothetical protein M3689_02280 [Alkalihalophilus marmarensis]|uniref:Uncharacterized protein n=1 Tax=Alkalihalophilus marmarensis DSM 21297 TaxID=1188261 RepID=U6STS0_9BACI|nr:hypothetical protein [Alkalihalophilus marmarensis]ERN54051.1 hypothetical protein A33I_08760 [Alkalihalophilus marmarensis DSM 21297]MCM3488130.1 hypothetical protein [Alkalihalophilus marmarensis]
MKRGLNILWLIFSGAFVLLFSLWMSGPGIAETDEPTYRLYFMIPFLVWLIGVFIQFYYKHFLFGFFVTLGATFFYVSLVVQAALL